MTISSLSICREDGKDSMKFYTDPTYFFELWANEMQKETEQQKKHYRQNKIKKVSQPHRLSATCYIFICKEDSEASDLRCVGFSHSPRKISPMRDKRCTSISS